MPKFYMISPNVRKMSLDATGLLFTMLNDPESDYCTVVQLCSVLKADSLNTIQTALQELVAKEYVLKLHNGIYAVNKLKIPQMKMI